MHHCVFAAPFALESTMRFLDATVAVPGVRVAVLSQEPITRIPKDIREAIVGFEQIKNALDGDQLADGALRLAPTFGGPIHSLVGILEQAQVPLAEARARLRLPGLSPDAARNFRDKSRMKDILRAHNLPCARHELARSASEARAMAARIGYPVVVKPPAGAGAKSTLRVDQVAQLDAYLAQTPPTANSPLLIEEFIHGREFSFDSISVRGRHEFGSVCVYRPTPLEVVQSDWIQWCVLLPREIDVPAFAPILEHGPRALEALGMTTGISHMEWFRRNDGSIAISEVGARPPGAQFMSLLSLAHDTDFYAIWARLMTGHGFDLPPRRFATGAAYLRAQGGGERISAVHGWDAIAKELGDLVVEKKLPQVGSVPSSSYEGDGYVLLRHPETAVVQRALERLVESVIVRTNR
ncbi:MAG: acetyl-CoA carboxylase biotin carboxylase subunit family protein [Planctomycetota bacterium]